MEQRRRCHDVFWLGLFMIQLIGLGFVLVILGVNRFKKKNRLDIDKYTYRFMENQAGLTEDYWPLYAVAGGVGTALGWSWLLLLDRLPFTMLVLQKAVKMVWNLPEVLRVAYATMALVLLWMALWSFGAAGVVVSSMGDGGRWWLLGVLSVSLFWTGVVLCNTLHVIVSGTLVRVTIHGSCEAATTTTISAFHAFAICLTSFGTKLACE
ncbi:unnamed protein product [Vicia faba]|uniref:Choline transporter-like protein n=1 Tax=Vicia faba TaxID=3906 RepID=A0AAV0YG01_VICFA|nr:unnamed protein product [Vicia faba]